MTRVRQTFTNELPDEIVIWVELECWCWLLKPGERLTVDFDAEGHNPDWEPLPITLSTDGENADRRFMLVLWQQGKTENSLFINDDAIVVEGEITARGIERFVGG